MDRKTKQVFLLISGFILMISAQVILNKFVLDSNQAVIISPVWALIYTFYWIIGVHRLRTT